jgi:predicted transcriptional regulator of viral defense system
VSYLEFRNKLFELACFTIQQVYAWKPDFDRNNLTRWVKKGYLVRLRQEYYAFTEYRNKPDYTFYMANRIYRPSYISLHTALSFYGMIPEGVVQITSVTSLKTVSFSNSFGEYAYHSFKENLLFGFELKPMEDGRTLQLASPEKALLDFLYLYSFYDNRQELEELRLDEDFLHHRFNKQLLLEYCSGFQSKALDQRVNLLIKVYEL